MRANATTVMDNTSGAWTRCWHAVATSAEVGDQPVAVQLLGERWVLVRLGGELVAFEDRCPHRLAPLSAGRVLDDTLQCGYHGWRFAGSGRCVAIPPIGAGPGDPITARADVRTPFGVQERYGLVWLAPQEPVCALHEFPEWDAGEDAGFDRIWSTILRTPVSAAQLVDNFLDASHFPYVHRDTFGDDRAALVVDEGIEREGWVVRTVFETWYRNFDDPLVATGEHEAVQPQRLTKQGDAGLTVYLRLEFPVTGSTFSILFCCQPESATSTRVYKLMARDDLAGDAGRIERCIRDEDQILAEDLAILERFEHMAIHLDPRVEVHTRADKLSVAWRRVLGELVGLDGDPIPDVVGDAGPPVSVVPTSLPAISSIDTGAPA